MFYSSGALRELQDEEKAVESIATIRGACEKQEIHEVLLTLAAGYRAYMDQNQDARDTVPCGSLWPTADTDAIPGPLLLREACNKILHAESCEFRYLAYRDVSRYSLLPRIRLHGAKDGTPWVAELEILHLVDRLFYKYRGDSDA